MDQKQLITIIASFFGVCATGFFFLALWIRGLSDLQNKELEAIKLDLKDRVDYKWLQGRFKDDIIKDITQMENSININFTKLQNSLEKINDVLVGTVEKKGIITSIHDHDKRINTIEEVCKKNHG